MTSAVDMKRLLNDRDIVDVLREIGRTLPGDPMPPSLREANSWGEALSAIANRAADEIESLRTLEG